jgi:hypothetical protein
MNDPLRREVLTPTTSGLARMIALSAGFGAASLVSVVVASGMRPEQNRTAATPRAPTAPSSELLFVFRMGDATYVRLADLEPTEVPPHGRLRFVDDPNGTAAIGSVKDADAPHPYRGYIGKRLRVDGGCSATVVDLAVVSRADDTLTLAARIDGCEQGSYARDATLSEVVRPTKIIDQNLTDVARSLVLASKPAADTQREWRAAALDGNWYDQGELSISVHGTSSDVDCGGPNVNIWGLFRVGPDRMLETVDIRRLETLHSIEHVIDIEGDGELELVGKSWPGLETVLVKAEGEQEIDRLTVPFFGCGC